MDKKENLRLFPHIYFWGSILSTLCMFFLWNFYHLLGNHCALHPLLMGMLLADWRELLPEMFASMLLYGLVAYWGLSILGFFASYFVAVFRKKYFLLRLVMTVDGVFAIFLTVASVLSTKWVGDTHAWLLAGGGLHIYLAILLKRWEKDGKCTEVQAMD